MSGLGFPSNQATYNAVSIFNALVPKEGPKMVPFVCNFPTAGSYLIDLTLAEAQQRISVVQNIFVDASAATEAVSIAIQGTQLTIVCPAGAQGYFPCLAPNNTKFVIASGSTAPVTVAFINVPIAANVWPVVEGGGGGGGAVEITAPLATNAPAAGATPVAVSQTGGVAGWTSHSASTNAAVSSALIPAVGAGLRSFVRIKAPETADLWVNPLGNTCSIGGLDCLKIPAGALYENFPGESVFQAWTYFCATGGLNYTALSQDGN